MSIHALAGLGDLSAIRLSPAAIRSQQNPLVVPQSALAARYVNAALTMPRIVGTVPDGLLKMGDRDGEVLAQAAASQAERDRAALAYQAQVDQRNLWMVLAGVALVAGVGYYVWSKLCLTVDLAVATSRWGAQGLAKTSCLRRPAGAGRMVEPKTGSASISSWASSFLPWLSRLR